MTDAEAREHLRKRFSDLEDVNQPKMDAFGQKMQADLVIYGSVQAETKEQIRQFVNKIIDEVCDGTI